MAGHQPDLRVISQLPRLLRSSKATSSVLALIVRFARKRTWLGDLWVHAL